MPASKMPASTPVMTSRLAVMTVTVAATATFFHVPFATIRAGLSSTSRSARKLQRSKSMTAIAMRIAQTAMAGTKLQAGAIKPLTAMSSVAATTTERRERPPAS